MNERDTRRIMAERKSEQDKYVGRAVTLHGKPAKIVRTGDGFAGVAPLDTGRGIVPYSWVAVFNVCDNHGGRFD